MDEIQLDGAAWQTNDDFYDVYLTAVGAPTWHGRNWDGRNLDAVWDSLMGGDINRRSPPFRFRITGLERMVRKRVVSWRVLLS